MLHYQQMRRHNIILLLALWTASSCTQPNQAFTKLIQESPYTVVMFIAPDCPMCKTLSTPYSELAEAYPEIQFIAVLSGKHYEAMELNMFATSTKLKACIFRDYDYEVAHQLGASVTPEFFVTDRDANVLYQGMMDDRLLELGNYKQKWDKHYLKNALDAILRRETPSPAKTDAVGCILEY